MHTQVRFIDKNQSSYQNTTNLRIPRVYSVRASFLAQYSNIKNENSGFVKDLYTKENMWTRNHSILKGFRQKRRSC